jgi:hypothetical protein
MNPGDIQVQCRLRVHPDCYNGKLVVNSVYAHDAENEWDAITNYQADGTFRYTTPPEGTVECDPCMLQRESQRDDLTPLQRRIHEAFAQSE